MSTRKSVEILDCTLRDGSYVIDFQFSLEHTKTLSAGLSKAGVKLIEVGHGVGLNGSAKNGIAKATDQEYIEAAKSSVGNQSLVGSFFIPGVGSYDDIVSARKSGLDFIRIGTDCFDFKKGLDSISKSKEIGLIAYSNLMKSYLMTPYSLALAAKEIEKAGADGISVVDSAGGMMPEEVYTYVKALVDTVDTPVGFHGHNNLGLANACAKAAVEAGAKIIDTTLQGMGRSAGNVQTESFVLILNRLGIETSVDPVQAMELGQKIVRPLLGTAGVQSEDLASGYSLFHSGFLSLVSEISKKFGVSSVNIILEYSKLSVKNPTRDQLVEIAAKISTNTVVKFPNFKNVRAAS